MHQDTNTHLKSIKDALNDTCEKAIQGSIRILYLHLEDTETAHL